MPEKTGTVRKKSSKRYGSVTLSDVVAEARKLERLTADPARVVNPDGEGREMRSMASGLITMIIEIPRTAKTLQDRVARAEAENVRLACHRLRWADQLRLEHVEDWSRQIEVAIQELDIAVTRFSILAR
jgi:hypothetical protein